jgi:replicative superfamily II helicase
MSATMPQVSDLALWLNASLFVTQFRPVQLKINICCENTIYDVNSTSDNVFAPENAFTVKNDDDDNPVSSRFRVVRELSDCLNGSLHSSTANTMDQRYQNSYPCRCENLNYVILCLETILYDNKSVIIFCDTKRKCESTAEKIVTNLEKYYGNYQSDTFSNVHGVATDGVNPTPRILSISPDTMQKRRLILQDLSSTSVGLCPILKQTIKCGVAYHHAGLTVDERKV